MKAGLSLVVALLRLPSSFPRKYRVSANRDENENGIFHASTAFIGLFRRKDAGPLHFST
jgi:hypothetical protein